MKVTVDLMGQQYCNLGKHLQTEKCYKRSQKKKPWKTQWRCIGGDNNVTEPKHAKGCTDTRLNEVEDSCEGKTNARYCVFKSHNNINICLLLADHC